MERRSFLALTLTGLSGAALPGWMTRAFAGEVDPDEAKKLLKAALKRAQEVGKPLLVAVIPVKDEEKWERGEVLGEFLNHAGAEALADLALCEMACATLAAARDLLPLPELEGEPLFLFAETTEGAPTVRPIAPDLTLALDGKDPIAVEETVLDRELRARIARIAKAVHARVAPDEATLERRASASLASIPEKERKDLCAKLDANAPIDIADRAAAALRLHVERGEVPREKGIARLAEAATARLLKRAPSGGRWAEATGCGTNVEGEEEEPMPACGMGFVPELSRRFLYFFTKGE